MYRLEHSVLLGSFSAFCDIGVCRMLPHVLPLASWFLMEQTCAYLLAMVFYVYRMKLSCCVHHVFLTISTNTSFLSCCKILALTWTWATWTTVVLMKLISVPANLPGIQMISILLEINVLAASVEPVWKLRSDCTASVERNPQAISVVFIEGESMSRLVVKLKVRQFVLWYYTANLEEYPAVSPEVIATSDLVAGGLHG